MLRAVVALLLGLAAGALAAALTPRPDRAARTTTSPLTATAPTAETD